MAGNNSQFTLIPAGVITKEQTLLPPVRLPLSRGLKVTQGQVCVLDTSTGFIIVMSTIQPVDAAPYVALATVDNTGNASGFLTAPFAKRGHFVTVTADNAIQGGDKIKGSTTTAGDVMRFIPGTDNNNLAIGVYRAIEGGQVSKSATSPYLESFTDTENFPTAAAANTNVIEVELF
jgi:hypothetical protein